MYVHARHNDLLARITTDPGIFGVAASATSTLAQAGHEAESVADWAQDSRDLAILAHATEHQQSVITLDKDFGGLVTVRGIPIEASYDWSISVPLTNVVAGVRFCALLPSIRLMNTSRFTSAQDFDHLEGLAVAIP